MVDADALDAVTVVMVGEGVVDYLSQPPCQMILGLLAQLDVNEGLSQNDASYANPPANSGEMTTGSPRASRAGRPYLTYRCQISWKGCQDSLPEHRYLRGPATRP
jgi:hypothetical protein